MASRAKRSPPAVSFCLGCETALFHIAQVLHRLQVARNLILGITIWLTVDSYQWAKHFAEASTRTGAEISLIIGAVLAAAAFLQGWVLREYVKGPTAPAVPAVP